MKITRVLTAEGKSSVITQVDEVLDTDTAPTATNIWGFDRIPDLPLRPEHVFGAYNQMGMFGPLGAIRVDLYTVAPEGGDETESSAAPIDMGTGGNMVAGDEGGGMHRTDTIDLIVVIEGEVTVDYPGEDGVEHFVTIKTGDFLVHNGVFHRWHNRSKARSSVLIVTMAAVRKTT